MRELVTDLWRLVQSWWNVDRIRVSPREGRLLRLQPPCILLVEGCPVEVLSRILGQSTRGLTIAYECRSAAGACRLTVQPAGNSTPEVTWFASGVERLIAEHEVEVFALARQSPA